MRTLVAIACAGCGLGGGSPQPTKHDDPRAAQVALVRDSITVGEHHACAVEATGRVACWGQGGAGRSGTADEIDHLAPIEVPGVDDVAGVAAGDDFTCAWTTRGAVWCWGGDLYDHRAGDHRARRVPDLDDVVQVVAGLFGACGLHANGRIACWKRDAWVDPLWPPIGDEDAVRDAVEIAGDDQHVCARLRSGDVTCKFAPDANHIERFAVLPELAGAISIGGDDDQFAALLPSHRLIVWNIADLEGRRDRRPAILSVDGVAGERVVVGGRDVCVIGEHAQCWNEDDFDAPAAHVLAHGRLLLPGVRDLAPGHDVSCARIGDQARCWGVIGRLGDGVDALPSHFADQPSRVADPVAVVNLALGIRRAVTPSPPPPEPIATPHGEPIELRARVLQGPFKTAERACAAQRCPGHETRTYCAEEVAAEAPGEAMTSPPAPFSEIRLVAFDCRDPEYTPDTLERRRLMVTRQDGVWLSQPLIDFGIQGEHCGTLIEPRWQAREISTQTHAVLTLLAGKRCSDDRRGRDVELIVVAGDGAKPFMYAPITTGASHVEDCAVGTAKCTPSEHAVKLSSSFTSDGLVLDGPTSWPAILRDKIGAIRGVGSDRIEQSSVGTYRFKRP